MSHHLRIAQRVRKGILYKQYNIGWNEEVKPMAENKEGYTCTVHYSEDTSKRMTEALTDLYYKMQKGIAENEEHDNRTA